MFRHGWIQELRAGVRTCALCLKVYSSLGSAWDGPPHVGRGRQQLWLYLFFMAAITQRGRALLSGCSSESREEGLGYRSSLNQSL